MIDSSSAFDELLAACGHAHRRIVLGLLIDHQRVFRMNELTKAVVEHNHHISMSEVSGEELKQIKISLHHTHVPKLADAGLLEYDSDQLLVVPTDRLEEIESHISPILDSDPVLARPAGL